MEKKSRQQNKLKKFRGIKTESGAFLEPTHYESTVDGKKQHWGIKLIYDHDFSFEMPDRWFIEQTWGHKWKPAKQYTRLSFDNELKARQKFDDLVYLKEQEGFRPIFK